MAPLLHLPVFRNQDAVMINMDRVSHVSYNRRDKTLTALEGTKFQAVYDVAYKAGRELTLGWCPCVGVAGASMGGGHGRLQGKYGLSADAIVKFRMVLGDGAILETSASENTDLSWVMRDAGHNFSLVVETTFKTWSQQKDGTINKLFPIDPAVAIDLLILDDPETLQPIVTLDVVYAGPLKKDSNLLTNFITRTSLSESLVPWNQVNVVSAGGSAGPARVDGPATNLYSFSAAHLDIATTLELFKSDVTFVKNGPQASASMLLWEIPGVQAVLAQPEDRSAVGNRRFAAVLGAIEAIYTNDSVARAADARAMSWRDQLAAPRSSGHDKEYCYVNSAHNDESRESIYGYELWRLQRLRELQRRHDPRRFFNGFHSFH
ncbi:FAD binding domain-containing protein [Nemania sp. NC0429]|nr:FAD binding domain-containing protein [Nemania sp. NC0429]